LPAAGPAPATSGPGAAIPGAETNPEAGANAGGTTNAGAAGPAASAREPARDAGAEAEASARPAPRRKAGNAPAAKPAAAAPESSPVAGNAPAAETPAATPAAAAPEKPVEKPLAADATLEIVCNHPFKQATLEIFVDGKPLFEGALEGKRKKLTLGITRGGRLEAKKELPSGRHTIRVRVKSEDDKYEDEATVTDTIAAHAVRTLKISFGEEGSGPGGGRKVRAELQ